jgi:hypothetical protein
VPWLPADCGGDGGSAFFVGETDLRGCSGCILGGGRGMSRGAGWKLLCGGSAILILPGPLLSAGMIGTPFIVFWPANNPQHHVAKVELGV